MATMRRSAVLTGVVLLTLTADAGAASRVSVADPAGGARWTATQTSTRDGRTCVTVRRARRAYGRSCARLSGRTVFSYVTRVRGAADPRATRTILVVTLARSVTRARLQAPGGSRRYRRRKGRPRVLLAVLAGRVERPRLTVDVRRDGRTTRLTEGPPPAVQVADPLGGPAFRSRIAAASGQDGACITWERVAPRFAAPPEPAQGRVACGDADADVPAASVQVVQGRLVVFGLAGANVRSAVLRTSQGDFSLALEPRTRALLAVLAAGADPAALRIVARLGDGREVERPVDVLN
jgi:hypothetical protein